MTTVPPSDLPKPADRPAEQISPHDCRALDAVGQRIAEMLADAGHDQAVTRAILAHALHGACRENLTSARYEVTIASERSRGHSLGAHVLEQHPGNVERFADQAHRRGAETSSLAVSIGEGTIEAVLRGWVKP